MNTKNLKTRINRTQNKLTKITKNTLRRRITRTRLRTRGPTNTITSINRSPSMSYIQTTKAQVKKIIDDIIVTNKIPQCEKKIRLYGMEVIKIKDIESIYKSLLGNIDNRNAQNTILSVYKIMNILIYVYSMTGMYWLEYYVVLPSGRDEFWYMVHNIPELFVFITSFAFLPKQLNSDWIFSLIVKDIGLLRKKSVHLKWISNENIINIIYSIQALLYRTVGKKLLVKVKNHMDDILILKNVVLMSNLSDNKKKRLRFLIVLLKTQKTQNPHLIIHKFERLIISSSKNRDEQRELLEEALIEGEKIFNRHKKLKQNGGK